MLWRSNGPAPSTASILTYRPPGTPRFGGHIERLIGTMMGEAHLLPGSHFSNVRERGDLDPEATAAMTLRELEACLALEIVGVYHARIHRSLDAPAERGLGGRHRGRACADADGPPTVPDGFSPGRAARAAARRAASLPHPLLVGRTAAADGARAKRSPSSTIPATVRRLRAELSDGYLEARPADGLGPPIALWEHRAAVAGLREAGRRAVDEELIFSTILAQRALVDAGGRGDQGDPAASWRGAPILRRPR